MNKPVTLLSDNPQDKLLELADSISFDDAMLSLLSEVSSKLIEAKKLNENFHFVFKNLKIVDDINNGICTISDLIEKIVDDANKIKNNTKPPYDKIKTKIAVARHKLINRNYL